MTKHLSSWIALVLGLSSLVSTAAKEEPAPDAAEIEKIHQWVDGLKFQTGDVILKGGVAKAVVPPSFKYLNPKDSAKYLKLLGNPPAETLGILFPQSTRLLEDDSYFVVLQYEKDGHVKDDDAAKIDYSELLKNMKEQSAATNEERVRNGFPAVEIAGWATPPHYDAGTHKLYWAKDLIFKGEESHTLNYNIRMLGREGVLVANAVGGMHDLPTIEKATPEILAMVDFIPGNRYEDFNESSDKVAEYGVAGLIAGGVGLKLAAKAGIFALILKKAAVFWKLILIGFVACIGFFKKLFGRKSEASTEG